ncbi:amidase [Simiduia aestuariiviva]|uniref:Amidase n=1 Tax=Simiduia aestuariiviva TaxID=1510459 RepID=A0A839UMD9_9GAMM|nr:amidase [Simiduia aestuariiviva]MBB3168873.1 amidase [Simiduia aestuariiviva]
MNVQLHRLFRFFTPAVVAVSLMGLMLGCQPSATDDAELQVNTALGKYLDSVTIPELQAKMDAGDLSSVQITQFFLANIAKKNAELNAIIQVNPEALSIASVLDQERSEGRLRGPLHGIPIVIKDNIETADMATTAGSLALIDNETRRDAPVVAKLRAAGAIILGKANLSEWANIRSERSSSGWSAIGGQARNPHDLNRSPCGSSAGSGVAVAANLAVAAIGTETNGSIVCPSSANGIVGIKPTVGLVSRRHIVPISHTQDTAGPMAKSVLDAAIILSVIQGEDVADPATTALAYDFQQNFKPDTSVQLTGKRIGVVLSGAADHEAVLAVFNAAKARIAQAGAVVIDDLKLTPYDGFYGDAYDVLLYELKADLNAYFSTLPSDLNQLTLAKVIQFNRDNAEREMPYFQQEIFHKSQAKGDLSDVGYVEALANIRRATRDNGIDKLMSEHALDAIISVTLGPAWSIDQLNGDHFTGSFSSYPAIAGYPHITLPMGKVHHMPVGLSITGRALDEKALIDIAQAVENALQDDGKSVR